MSPSKTAMDKARAICTEIASEYLKMKHTLESALTVTMDMISGGSVRACAHACVFTCTSSCVAVWMYVGVPIQRPNLYGLRGLVCPCTASKIVCVCMHDRARWGARIRASRECKGRQRRVTHRAPGLACFSSKLVAGPETDQRLAVTGTLLDMYARTHMNPHVPTSATYARIDSVT